MTSVTFLLCSCNSIRMHSAEVLGAVGFFLRLMHPKLDIERHHASEGLGHMYLSYSFLFFFLVVMGCANIEME